MSYATPSTASPLKPARIHDSFFSARKPELGIKRLELRFSMFRKYVVIPPENFLRRFAPPVDDARRGRFTDILIDIPVKIGREADMYKPLIDAVNDHNVCPGFTLVATPLRGDPSDSSNEAVDVGLYAMGSEPQAEVEKNGRVRSLATNWSTIELCVECKADPDSQDPFNDEKEQCEPNTDEKKSVLGQILSYAELVFKRQQRTSIFMILLLGDSCRILRFDRSGVVTTQKFNYKTNGSIVVEFLWRFARWSAEQRGHDPSAELIPHDSALGKEMKRRALKGADASKPDDYVRSQFADSLKDDWSWWKLRVDDRDGKRSFLVGKPHFQAPGVAGRGTRGYVALDAENIAGPFYYLKDAWRVVNRGIDKEGTILNQLNQKGVRYIPSLECHGDGHGSESTKQVTKTQQVWRDLHKGAAQKEAEDEAERPPFKKHTHYRIVVREVGRPMADFRNGRQLVHALYCCIYAHSEAYEAGVIHRDISAGNVLLYFDPVKRKWVGLLNDWELSKQTNCKRPEGRQIDRTGTWQFMSAQALDNPGKSIVVEDELESFFHVLLYFAIRFLPHNCPKVSDFMHSYFDDYVTFNGGHSCGKHKMVCMMNGIIDLVRDEGKDKVRETLKFSLPSRPGQEATKPAASSHPLNDIFALVLEWLQAYYEVTQGPEDRARHAPQDAAQLGALDDTPLDSDLDFPDRRGAHVKLRTATKETKERRRMEQQELAESLHTHNAFLDLLEESLKNKERWPEDDKVEDQLSKRGYDPKDDVYHVNGQKGGSIQQNAISTGSTKRKSEHLDEPANQARPKRSKSQASSRGTRRKVRAPSSP
ncbi:hypothetical protein BV20DRAFT_954056 [Pilatotrama ljubarskyi]|nr:hypothetical protein BV20DRAFT_954056 [Pilatotrama ljubarskyi]